MIDSKLLSIRNKWLPLQEVLIPDEPILKDLYFLLNEVEIWEKACALADELYCKEKGYQPSTLRWYEKAKELEKEIETK